jgi:hypothetical protein
MNDFREQTLQAAKNIEKQNKQIVVTASNATRLSLRQSRMKINTELLSSREIRQIIKRKNESSDIFNHHDVGETQSPIYALTKSL